MILLRVELREDDPEGRLQQRLEAALHEAGFAKTIQRPDGTRFKLPAGEYRAPEEMAPSLRAARDLATAAARSVEPACALLLTQVEEWVGVGLKVKM
ncbi:MAG TPA: hypothetical protein VMB50_16970 [Myxococcales bacterium]|nr:hypothetical protein [Myxococcales bacterium]